jgi:hypothetical protein
MVSRDTADVLELKIQAREAVDLAMNGRWEEAAAVNRLVIAASPSDVEAFNRLGKSLLELGDPVAAREAFQHSLSLSPTNPIARKNIERLSNGIVAVAGTAELTKKMLIGDAGKSANVLLLGCATSSERPSLTPGSAIELRVHKGNLVAYTPEGHYVGIVPPRVGHRLVALMEGGNCYNAGIVNSTADTIRVVLQESYQHPSLRSKASFPSMAAAPEPATPDMEDPPADSDSMDDPESLVVKPVAETPAEELRELDGPDADVDVGFVDALAPLESEAAFEEELEEAI